MEDKITDIKKLKDYQEKDFLDDEMEELKENYNDNPLAKEYHQRVVDSREYSFWRIFSVIVFISLISLAVFFLYYVNQEKFKGSDNTILNNNVSVEGNNIYVNATDDIKPIFNNNATIIIQKVEVVCQNGGCFQNIS